jgi:flagellar biosynthesis protein FlhF
MYFKHFRGANVRDALRAARQELGPEAIVLSSELVAAPGWRGWVGGRLVQIAVAAEREASDRRPSESVDRQGTRDAASRETSARLVAAGLSEDLAREIVSALPGRARRDASLDSLRTALAGRLSSLAAPDEGFAPVEVFVGPPGSGKTTTIAKIAAQARARRGELLGLVAADGFRIGAIEQLRSYAEIIGSSFQIAHTSDDLRHALRGGPSPVLVDTAGRSRDDDSAREVLRMLGVSRAVRTHLVLAADTPVASAKRVFAAYGEARPTRVVLTKLDEAESISPLVGLLREWKLPISYLGIGQRVPEDLNRATAQLLAASVLGEAVPAHAIHS